MREMTPLDSCTSCGGLVPRAEAACPHCGRDKAPVAKATSAVAIALAGAGFAVTLMACYGPPPREYEKVDAPPPPSPASTDAGPADMPKAK